MEHQKEQLLYALEDGTGFWSCLCRTLCPHGHAWRIKMTYPTLFDDAKVKRCVRTRSERALGPVLY